MADNDFFGNIGNVLGGVGSIVDDIYGLIDKFKGKKGTTNVNTIATPVPVQNQNSGSAITVSDFKFTPNFYLLAFGCGLLAFAWTISKKR